MKILLYYDQSNIELHYTEAISKHWFGITQSDIDTVQERDVYSFNSPLPAIVFIIFWDSLIFYQIFYSQAKQCVIIIQIYTCYIQVASQVAKQLQTWDLRKLGNVKKVSNLHRMIA